MAQRINQTLFHEALFSIHRLPSTNARSNKLPVRRMAHPFTCEFFNQRGVHGFSAGEQERQLAAGFHKKADALEEKGYQRIATAVRELAKGYEREAEQEAKRNPLEG